MNKKTYILFTFLLISFTTVFSQQTIITKKGVEFSVRVKVVDERNNQITKNVEIEANGIYYALTDVNGRFNIKGKVGDQIRVSHPDFETVYHTLTSSEDIKVIVENYEVDGRSSSKYVSKSKAIDFYLQYIDSAKFYQKKRYRKKFIFY